MGKFDGFLLGGRSDRMVSSRGRGLEPETDAGRSDRVDGEFCLLFAQKGRRGIIRMGLTREDSRRRGGGKGGTGIPEAFLLALYGVSDMDCVA